jgi:hypothetical protein
MGINDKEREYLNYKPKMGYIPKILSVVDPQAIYEMPPVIKRLTDVLGSDLLDELTGLIGDINVLQRRMEQCLQDSDGGGVSFKDYKKEKRSANPDYSKISAYETYHATNLNGRTQAEVYPLLVDMGDELTEYRDFLNKQLFDGQANYEHIDVVRQKEKNKIDKLIESDMQGKVAKSTFRNLAVKAQMMKYHQNRIENSKKFTKDLNGVLCYTPNTYYNGNVRKVVEQYATADVQVLDHLNSINKVKFNKTVVDSEKDKRRNAKLNSKEIKQGMNNVMQTVANAKTTNSDSIMEWAKTIDTDFDSSPLTQVVADILDKVEFINKEYDKTVMEMYKHNKVDEMVKSDQIQTLTDKKATRQVTNLISDIITEKNNGTFHLDKFLLDRKLENPGTLCTQ